MNQDGTVATGYIQGGEVPSQWVQKYPYEMPPPDPNSQPHRTFKVNAMKEKFPGSYETERVEPFEVDCFHCGEHVVTSAGKVMSQPQQTMAFVFGVCLFFPFLGFFALLCLLNACINPAMYDRYHYCPNCMKTLAVNPCKVIFNARKGSGRHRRRRR